MRNKKIVTVLAVLLVFSSQVYASWLAAAKDIITDLTSAASLGLAGALVHVVEEIVADAIYVTLMYFAFIRPLSNALTPNEFNNFLLGSNPNLIEVSGSANPLIASKVDFFIQILAPFYALAFVILALYLLLVSSSPEGRARAKGSLLRLILSAAFIVFTIPIVQALLDISLYLTTLVVTTNKGNIEIALMTLREGISGVWFHVWTTMPFDYWLAMPLLLYIALIASTPFVVIGIRYFMILVFTMLFPLGVFLYSMHFTHRVGKSLIRQTALWVFIQPAMAIILSVTGIAAGPLLDFIPDPSMVTAFGLAGFMALAVTPLMMVGILNFIEVTLIAIEAAMEVPLAHIIASTEELEVKE